MRLIDADEFALRIMQMQAINEKIPLKKELLDNKEINCYDVGQKETFDLILQNLEKQPTAYNVDKVVEQLEKETSGLTSWAEDMAYKMGIEKAIKIVKAGGINE